MSVQRLYWLFHVNLQYSLDCDVSDYGIGWAVFEIYPDGELKPIGFLSLSLVFAAENYFVSERKCLAVVRKLKRFVHISFSRSSQCTRTILHCIGFSLSTTQVDACSYGDFVSPSLNSKSNTRRVKQIPRMTFYRVLTLSVERFTTTTKTIFQYSVWNFSTLNSISTDTKRKTISSNSSVLESTNFTP